MSPQIARLYLGSQSRPRLFQLHIRPARFCPALLIIENITNIFLPFWTLGGRCGACLLYKSDAADETP